MKNKKSDPTSSHDEQNYIESIEYQFNSLTRILNHQSNSPKELNDFILQEALGITQSKIGTIFRYSEEQQQFTLSSWSKDLNDEFKTPDSQAGYELSEKGIWRKAINDRKAIIVNKFEPKQDKTKDYTGGHLKIKKLMACPIIVNDKIVSVIVVANKETDYTESDIHKLQLLMNTAWKVIEKHKLSSRQEHLKNLLNGIRKINRLIIKENDPQIIISKTCENLTESMGYHSAWIAILNEQKKVSYITSSGLFPDFEKLKNELYEGKFPLCMQQALEQKQSVLNDSSGSISTGYPGLKKIEEHSQMCSLISHLDKVFGVLVVSTPAEDMCLNEEKSLLGELADDLGFCLLKIETEKRLKESEEKFRLITEYTGETITVLDLNLKITYVSPSIKKLRGFTVEEAMEQSPEQIFTPGSLQIILKYYREKMAQLIQGDDISEEVLTLELEEFHKNGNTFWAEVSISFMLDNTGKPFGIITISRDISERKKIQTRISESQRQLSTLISNLPGMVYRCKMDKDWTMLYMSEGCKKLTGYDPADFIHNNKLTFNSIILPEYRNELWNKWQDFTSRKDFFEAEYEIMTKNGEIRWVWERGQGVYDSNDKVEFLEGFITDISESKRLLEISKNTELTVEKIFETLPVGIWFLDNSGMVVKVNDVAKDLWGIEKLINNEDFSSFTAIRIHSGEKVNLRDWGILPCLKEGVNIADELLEIITFKGEKRIIIFSASPINDQHGNITGAIILNLDITNQKMAEEELKLQEAKFRSLVQNSKDIISMYAIDGTILYKSPGLTPILGYDPEEVVGTNVYSMIHPEDTIMVKKLLTELLSMQIGGSKRFNVRALHKNDSTVWLEATLTNMLNESGVRAIVGNYRNITRRVHTDAVSKVQYNIADAVVKAKNLYQLFEVVRNELSTLLDTTNFIIALYDEKTGLFTSPFEADEKTKTPPSWPAANSLTGLVIRKKHGLLLQKKDILSLAEQNKIVLRGSRAECWLGVPLIINNKPIGVMIIQSYSNPNAFDKASKEMLEIVANQLSIYIEQKNTELNSLKLSKAIIQSPTSIIITDPSGTIEFVNPKFTQLTGFSAEEAIGRNPNILKSGEQNEAFYKKLWDTITSGNDWSGELLNKKKNGELYWESVSISPLINDDGVITHFVGVKEDITDRKKMIADLIVAKDQAEAGARLKTAFMNNISHEIRTPLNGITGFGQLISQPGLSDEERDSYMEILQSSTERLINTINDYMDASLLASENLTPVIATFGLNQLFDEICSTIEQKCRVKNIRFSYLPPIHEQHIQLLSDRELLKKVLFHLLGNAVKFTKAGEISTGFEIENDHIEFFVKDTGIGISSAALESIFDAFNQEEISSTRNYEGSGLGLTITKGILKLLGGNIRVISEKEKGSEFRFTLPVTSTFTSKTKTNENFAEVNNENEPLVLIAEDDDSNYFFLDILLRKASVNLMRARNGQEAVELCRTHPEISLVLMDIKMPIMDGIEATKQIKSFRKSLPIIAVTAHALTGDEHRILQAGCDDYIAKPLKKELLWLKLNKAGIKIS